MQTKIWAIVKELELEITLVKNLEDLKQITAKYMSKSSVFNSLKDEVKITTDVNRKKELGQLITLYSSSISNILNAKKEQLENHFDLEEKENELLLEHKVHLNKKEGTLHPFMKISNKVAEYFEDHNFKFAYGVEIEEEKFNFDILNVQEGHSVRNPKDTFYLQNKKVLRTHATNVTARELSKDMHEADSFYTIGTVFRNDDDDATHSFQFNQIDFFSVSKDSSIATLKFIIDGLVKHLFGEEIKTRYRLSYFPFTEPSFEVDMSCMSCHGKGCSVCKETGFIEVLGCGMINPKVIKNANQKSDLYGFAAGIGLERVAMLKWKVNDIRNFYINDIKFLKGIN